MYLLKDAEGGAGRQKAVRTSREGIYGGHETGHEVREKEEAKD